MLTLNDIINVGFRKSGFSGYRTDDVDGFVDRVKESFDELLKKESAQDEEIGKLKEENRQNVEKLKVLAAKIEEYRAQEDEIKNALISAQKLSEASVREARHKAEIIVKDADRKAEHIVADAGTKIEEQKKEFARIQKAVSDFRSKLLSIYKEHLTLIDALPTSKPGQPEISEAKQVTAPEAEAAPDEPAAPAADTPSPNTVPETEFQAEISNFDE
ncbi:MAG: DivIVA domain-containing protein [Oscillospiraceae bacterium]|nr:DivIVA domain-containing protein [Oscillospiraceae bacterium]MCI2035572.1 DivIVA domain-containing protein [Oscillospiraceae bacterium]